MPRRHELSERYFYLPILPPLPPPPTLQTSRLVARSYFTGLYTCCYRRANNEFRGSQESQPIRRFSM